MKKTYILHATYRYVTKQKETGETYSAQSNPTLSVEAHSQAAAERKALKQMRERRSTDWWRVISDSINVGHVTVIEHPTPAQLRVLRRFRDGGNSGANAAMIGRLVDKGWLEGAAGAGYVLTARGRTEAG